ncbi:hypothetical protein EB796_016137 [Bugula neritina]|uniref:Uncharacterized protein n=1 Tax=Bugula neritina TaxID=10212 RepID=A0A7J7JJ49_BUGNE|nr:hypothetical protein EB796_016137 [Bugula neritina]
MYCVENIVMVQLQQAKLTNQRLEEEKSEILYELRKFKGHSAVNEYDDQMVEKARKYDSALKDQAVTSTMLYATQQERDKFKMENEKLKRELANFGPEFFEEIEDLKYNYQESEIRNAQLEEKLNELCKQFGVSL